MTTVPAPRAPRALGPLALLLILGALAATGAAPCLAQEEGVEDREGDVVSVFSGDVTIPPGVHQQGNVVAIGGDVTIEGRVDGDVVAILGDLDVRGTVDGNVTGVLSDIALERAEVAGNLVSVAGELDVRGSTIDGEMVNVLGSLERDGLSRTSGQVVNIGFASLWTILFWLRLFHKFMIFVLLLFLVALVPERVRLIGEEAAPRYLAALLVGFAGYLGALVLSSLLSVTLIGWPAFWLGFAIAKWLGIAGLFHVLGRRLGRAFGLSLSLASSVLLAFALYAVLFLVPAALGFLGFLVLAVLWPLFFLLVECPALGLVILTRLGSSVPRARGPGAAVVVPAPAAPPAGP